MRKFVVASAAVALFFGASPVLAQEPECPAGQFKCMSLNACATGPQCDEADKSKGFSGQQGGHQGNTNQGGQNNFNSGNNNQGGQNNFNQGNNNNGNFNQNQNGQQGGNNSFNQGNNGGNNNNGNFNNGPMNDEQMQKQDEQRQKQDEERQKKDDARMKNEQERQVKQVKGDIKRFAGDVKRMKSEIARQEKGLKKCGIGLPQDIASALSETDALIAKAATLTDAEEIQSVQMDLHEKMQTVQESQQGFGYLQGFCRMLPDAEKMMKQAVKEYARVVKQAQRNTELDLTEVIADYDKAITIQKETLQKVKATMTTKPEEAMETMQSDFFPGFEDVFNAVGHIDALANSAKGVKSLESQLKRAKKNRDNLEKRGKDVSLLSDAISQMEDAIGDVKAIRKEKKLDPEDMMGAFEDAFTSLEEVGNALEEFGISNPAYAKKFGPSKGPNWNVPQFKGMPQMPQRGGGDSHMMDGGGQGFGPSQGGQGFGPGGGPGFGGQQNDGGPGGFPSGDQGFGPGGPGGFPQGPGAQKKADTQVAQR